MAVDQPLPASIPETKRRRSVTKSDPTEPESGDRPNARQGAVRRTRGIRFSDSEWSLVQRAASRHGVPAGELVRTGALALAEERLGEPPPATLSKGHAALIEEIYRFVYVMATLDREELLDAERGRELDDLVSAARRAMAQTMDEGPA